MGTNYRAGLASDRLQLRTLIFVALGICATAARGQVTSPNASAPATPPDAPTTNIYQGEYFTSDLTEVFRLRHIEGRGQGDVPAFTNVGFTKFVWNSSGLLMLDLGARVTNEADGGFTGGAHLREIFGNYIVGVGMFYDLQEFSQGSVAFEVFSRNWTFRANGYGIIGDDVESDIDYVTTPGTVIGFNGNNIVADGLELDEIYEVAMDGVDFEIARNVGWRSAEAFVGGYYLDGEIGGDTVGGKGGMRGFLIPDLAASVTVSHDDIFDTNVYGGFTWFFGANGGLSRPIVNGRLTIPVERNEQIAVNTVRRQTPVVGTVVLEFEDDPIVVVHVDSNAAGPGDGTFEDPFDTMPGTQDADIVYVHSGSMLTDPYQLGVEQRLLGEGDSNLHLVEIDDLGEIILPESTPGGHGLPRPVFSGIVGDAVTLAADDNEVSNFRMTNTVGNGIAGDGITDFDINRNIITGTMGDAADPMLLTTGRGIFLTNVFSAVDVNGNLTSGGDVEGNEVAGSEAANIEIVLGGDFLGEVNDNIANNSVTAEGIFIHGPFAYVGEVSGNTATGNFTDGIGFEVDEFLGEVENNTTNANMHAGLALAFGIFNGEVTGNTANNQVVDVGIDLSIAGDGRSVFEVSDNTTNNNGSEGILVQFSGTGLSFAQVLDNNLAGNNGGTGREFIAFNEDVAGNAPKVFLELDGSTSTNAVGAGPPFNFEFDNEDLFSSGEMTVEVGANVGTVEIDPEIEFGDFPL
jgi:hypothetical protein